VPGRIHKYAVLVKIFSLALRKRSAVSSHASSRISGSPPDERGRRETIGSSTRTVTLSYDGAGGTWNLKLQSAGGYTEVSRVAYDSEGWTITTTSAEGRAKTYERETGLTEDTRRVTDASGLTSVMTRAATAAMTVTFTAVVGI
jgi:hypothetical protein